MNVNNFKLMGRIFSVFISQSTRMRSYLLQSSTENLRQLIAGLLVLGDGPLGVGGSAMSVRQDSTSTRECGLERGGCGLEKVRGEEAVG